MSYHNEKKTRPEENSIFNIEGKFFQSSSLYSSIESKYLHIIGTLFAIVCVSLMSTLNYNLATLSTPTQVDFKEVGTGRYVCVNIKSLFGQVDNFT